MYSLYLDGCLLPVTPRKIETTIGGKSRLVTLINDGQASIPSAPELTEISFTALLPQVEYPFAHYEKGFQPAEIYLAKLEELKTARKPFRFILSRWTPAGRRLFDTNLSVSLEEYAIIEDAGSGFDLEVRILLRQHRPLESKTIEIDADLPDAPVILEENRAVDSTASSGSSSGNRGSGKSPSSGTKEAQVVADKVKGKINRALGKSLTDSIPKLGRLFGSSASGSASGGSGRVTLRLTR